MKYLKPFNYFYEIERALLFNLVFRYENLYLGGSRKSAKTWTVILFIVRMSLMGFPLRVYIFRKYVQDIEQSVWEETLNCFRSYFVSPKVTKHYRRIRFQKTLITYYGLHDRNKAQKTKLSGLSSIGHEFKYSLIWFEEAYEFNQKDIEDIKEAIRGKTHRLYIYTFNPWSLSNWIVKYCHSQLPFNLHELRENGEQLHHRSTSLFHYVNYQLNYFLSLSDINHLNELKITNPTRAKTACYGYFGIESGAIYSHALEKVSRNVIKDDIHKFVCGVDYGFRHDATTLIIVGFRNNYEKVQVLGEYYHSNQGNMFKDHQRMANDIIDTLIKTTYKFPKMNYSMTSIFVDNSNYTFIEILNHCAISRRVHHMFRFKPSKKVEVYYRVQLQLNIMECSRLVVDKSCIWFWKELQLARWKESTNIHKPIPEDKDNHTQDAFHYAITPHFQAILRKSNPYFFKNKLK